VKTVAENLELSTHDFLDKFKRQKPSPQSEIIFTCRSGKRAGDACEIAEKLGFKK
jgi:rhodanese-related sulfurtransferase